MTDDQQTDLEKQLAELRRELAEIKALVSQKPPEIPAGLVHAIDHNIRENHEKIKQAYWRSIGDLRGFAFKMHSQNGEDGVLNEIFLRVGTTNRFFVEFGVETGEQCNTRYLVDQGWNGVYFEPVQQHLVKLKDRWKNQPGVKAIGSAVTSENFESLLDAQEVPTDFDLLSIDIDGNDYWVWKSLTRYRPRVVVIEYNAFRQPPQRWVMKEDNDYRWNRTTYFGASFTSLRDLGRQKGYRVVGTDPKGVNVFFVREELWSLDKFLDPELHYFFQPFGYAPPKAGDGPFVEV